MALWAGRYPSGRPRDIQEHPANHWGLDSLLPGLQVLLGVDLQSQGEDVEGHDVALVADHGQHQHRTSHLLLWELVSSARLSVAKSAS